MNQQKDLLSHNLTYLKIVGLWPIRHPNNVVRLLHKIYGIIIFLYVVMFYVTQYIDAILNRHLYDLQKITTNLSTSLMTMMGLRKVYSLLRHGNKYQKIVTESTAKDRNIPMSKDLGAIYCKTLNRARMTSFLFWGLVMVTAILLSVLPFMDFDTTPNYCCKIENGTRIMTHVRPFIFSAWLPVSPIDYYYIYYSTQIILIVIGGSYQAVWDSFFFSLLIHAIGQLKVLNYRITNIGSEDTENDTAVDNLSTKHQINNHRMTIREKQNYDDLVECINEHVYIIRYVKTLNEITSPIMFMYYFVCGIMLCAQGFLTLMDGFTITLKLQYLVAMVIQLFVFFWHADEVIDEMGRLMVATYECKWYNQSKSFKKSLMNFRSGLLMRVNFTAGSFFVMSIPTFLGIVKMSYSFFAVLRKMHDEKPIISE